MCALARACYPSYVDTVREALEKINIRGQLRQSEPMAAHTSFRIGGQARFYALPDCLEDIQILRQWALARGIPSFYLGGGSNILVSDSGLDSLVIDLSLLGGYERRPEGIYAQAGILSDSLCSAALREGLFGMEFLAGIPGSLGGAIYMNARCYEAELADILISVDILKDGRVESVAMDPGQWAYKRSPFQAGGAHAGAIILGALLNLKEGERSDIQRNMEDKRQDRVAKGHYRFPSAGSVFKNNRAFGEPTGKILDRLGFRGMRYKSAAVSDYHANIFINPGAATASDMAALMDIAQERVQRGHGFQLEREVILVGDFS